mmetsp:Transcript_45588/g.114722  ORF Transcript_45588/g.114722 Transcript_45588/m.114722 type:complete len:234 (-) Transcript_45588:1064-1765(-)
MAAAKSVLVYGGCGALGSAVVTAFKGAAWHVISVDFRVSATADESITLKGQDLEADVSSVSVALGEKKLDAVVNVAGGWAGGALKGKGVFASVDQMWRFNVQSAVAASHIACNFLKENGVVTLTGAHAALGPTPGMIGYGISKAATHQIVRSLAAEGGGLPSGARVAAVLPITLDTEMNRKGMPDADFSTWTSLQTVAECLLSWCDGSKTPENGAMFSLVTKDNKTEYVPASM